jgi:hypothetical protein
MRKIASSFLALSLLCMLSISPALAHEAGELTEHVTFNSDIWVNNTKVESGEYKLVFEPEISMLKIMDGDDVVAQARASMKVNPEKADRDVVYTFDTQMGRSLQSVKFGGQREEVVIHPTQEAASITYFYYEEL